MKVRAALKYNRAGGKTGLGQVKKIRPPFSALNYLELKRKILLYKEKKYKLDYLVPIAEPVCQHLQFRTTLL